MTAIHGPMIDRRISKGPSAYDEDSFRRVMMRAEPAGEMKPAQLEALHQGAATGILAGGTLTQLMASMGTPWAFDPPEGCVLFIEDIGERPYRIHRMLTQAAQAGMFANARAIVFGEFPGCDEPGGDPAIRDVLRDFMKEFRGPVLFNFPSGHTSGPTWTLPFGVKAEVVGGPTPMRAHPGGGGRVGRRYDPPIDGTTNSSDRRVRHRDGDAGGAAQASRARRQRIRRARLSADERFSRGRSASTCSRAIAPNTSPAAPDLVVVGNAISRGNAELEAVLDRGIRYASLPETIRDQWLWDAHSIVIAGTHGKTTTTALTGWLLTAAGADPTVLIGGIARNFGDDGASYRIGKGKAFVIEGDEYDSAYFDKTAKFLKYLPDIAVVNNIEFDHADIYRDLDEVRLAFRRLVNLVPRNGPDAARRRQPGRGGAGRARAQPRADVRPGRRRRMARPSTSRVGDGTDVPRACAPAQDLGEFTMPLLGDHNVRNALAAIAVGVDLGLDVERLRNGLRGVQGRQAPARGGRRGARRHGLRRLRASSHRGRGDAARRVRRAAPGQAHLGDLRAALRLVVPARVPGRLRAGVCRRGRSGDRVGVPIEPAAGGAAVRSRSSSTISPPPSVRARHLPDVDAIVEPCRSEARDGDLIVVMSNGGFGGIHASCWRRSA